MVKFLDNLISLGQLPLITHPTRITPKNATLLDFISTNNCNNEFQAGIIVTSFADHLPTFYIEKTNFPKKTTSSTTFRDFSEENILCFNTKIRNKNWDKEFSLKFCQPAFTAFNEGIKVIFDECFPLKTTTKNRACIPTQPWMTESILKSRKTKEKLLMSTSRKS